MAIATIAHTYPDTCTVTLAIAVCCMHAVCTPCCNTVPGCLWLFCGTYMQGFGFCEATPCCHANALHTLFDLLASHANIWQKGG